MTDSSTRWGGTRQLLADGSVSVGVSGRVCGARRLEAPGSHGSQADGRESGQNMPKPSQPSLMASCSILCTSS